jgi:nitrous oxidase accessory protein NosD
LFRDLFTAFLALYAPTGSGPGKGAFDLVACRDVRVTGCRLSALGDTMHIQRSQTVLFANNQITGSRMGAFFLAEYCKNATITGNTVDGTNGSRVISVEKSCEDVTIVGNTFRNGGRGSWINQPKNFVMTGNVFVNNTTKNERDPRRGRRSFLTGDYEQKPELYFTLHEQGGSYGPVIVRDNIFVLGAACGSPAVTFAPGGGDLQFNGNTFRGAPALIRVDPSCANSDFSNNTGAEVKREPVDFNHGRR